MLDETSPKKQSLPIVDQLKPFLLVLEEKIGCSSFVGDLEGWRMILLAPETSLQPLFGIPDSLDNSNPATPMEADSGGHEANTSLDGEQSKAQSMPQSGSSSEEAASLTSRSHPSNLMGRISSPKKPKIGEENNSLLANINLGSLGLNGLLSGYWTSSCSYQSFQAVPLGGRSSVPKRRSLGVWVSRLLSHVKKGRKFQK